MATKKKIIDASVAAKWFMKEEDSDIALKIRNEFLSGEIALIAPELIFIEVLNALRYKANNEESLSKANKDLWDLELTIEKLDENIMEKAIQMSLKYDVSIYDAIYVALADIHSAPLITADKELAKIPSVFLLNKS